MPDVLRAIRRRLVEVGTTNRTRLDDYARALKAATSRRSSASTRATSARSASSSAPSLGALAALAHAHGALLIEDLGGGALIDLSPYGLRGEPLAPDSIAAGCDVVCFSTDKVLGGPQGGVIVGRAEPVERARRDPLARAFASAASPSWRSRPRSRSHRDPHLARRARPRPGGPPPGRPPSGARGPSGWRRTSAARWSRPWRTGRRRRPARRAAELRRGARRPGARRAGRGPAGRATRRWPRACAMAGCCSTSSRWTVRIWRPCRRSSRGRERAGRVPRRCS